MAATQTIGKLSAGTKDSRRARERRKPALAARGRRFPDHKIRSQRQGRGEPAWRFFGLSVQQQWVKCNGAQYKGEWVVLDGDRLVGHGPDPKEFYDLARAQGVKSPFVVHLPTGEELPWGGW